MKKKYLQLRTVWARAIWWTLSDVNDCPPERANKVTQLAFVLDARHPTAAETTHQWTQAQSSKIWLADKERKTTRLLLLSNL